MPMTRLRMTMTLLAAFASSAAAHPGHGEDEAAIKAVVMDYFDGIGTADAARLNAAFSEDEATMVGVVKAEDGAETVRAWKDMTAVIANWAGQESPDGAGRDHDFLDIHVTDGRIASVHFRYTDGYYDLLSLAKVDSEWTIIAKTFIEQ